MFAYFVLVQLFLLGVHGKHHRHSTLHRRLFDVFENDPNLNEGFDLQAFRQNQLDLHNHYRGLHGVSLMTLDPTLTTHAQAYAETLAANNNGLIHCADDPNCNTYGEGENLASASGGTSAETNATKNWYDEIWFYDFCSTSSALKRPGHNDKMVGHFTQVVWQSSTELGIGYARTTDKTKVYVVGRYLEHGNVQGFDQYKNNVLVPNYILSVYQPNCNGVSGSLSSWSAPGECTVPCGGGVKLQTKTCTNPKPSYNGADCTGTTKQLASQEWCNTESCSGDLSHLDKQCAARGKPADGHLQNCILYCNVGGTYWGTGIADDGTHCSSSGACLEGTCMEMSAYAPPSGQTVTGSWTNVPGDSLWSNKFLEVPNGATGLTIINHDQESATIYICYVQGWGMGCSWVNTPGSTYNGVAYTYAQNTITIAGPVQMTSTDMVLAFFASKGDGGAAHITWTYTT